MSWNLRHLMDRYLSHGPKVADRPLDADQWHEVLIRPETREELVSRVRSGTMSSWCRFVVEVTAPAESVLEIASGTGELSLQLASLGRAVTLLDFSLESLRFSELCAADLGLRVHTVHADILQGIPLDAGLFDCSFSSGLLEHFDAATRQAILTEQSRVTRGKVVSLVPNAACLAYRIGKADQETRGTWRYGLETPLQSQQEDFARAGLTVLRECTMGAKHAKRFLTSRDPLSRELGAWIDRQPEADLIDCRQGYLLATVGSRSCLSGGGGGLVMPRIV